MPPSINSTSGNIAITAAAGDITMLTSPGSESGDPQIVNNASTGSITLQAGPGQTLTADSTGATAIKSSNGSITLIADAMFINKGVNSGTAATSLTPASVSQAISLGGNDAPGVLGLTQAELNEITAGTLRIGSIIAGNITITAAISNPPGSNTLSLINNGSISEGTFSSLTIPNLRISSTGPVTLGSANNIIATLAATATNGLTVNDGTHILAIGTVDGVAGIATNNSAVNLTADNINISQQVN